MNLTPIRIPGKNRINYTKNAIKERKSMNRKPGRPINIPRRITTTAASPSTCNKSRSLKNIKSKRKWSSIEKLPTELLEKVFFFCMNLNLPMASPILAAKLSSNATYSKTLMIAFCPTWELSHEAFHMPEYEQIIARMVAPASRPSPGSDFRKHPAGNLSNDHWLNMVDPELQSGILRCRWATLDRILKAKQDWVEIFAVDRPVTLRYFVKSKNSNPTKRQIEESKPVYELGPSNSINTTPQEYLERDYESFSQFAIEKDRGFPSEKCSTTTNGDLAPDVEIPERLLTGPWTETLIRKLFWMVKSGAKVEWIRSTSGEAASTGIRTAISEGNMRVLQLLVWAGTIEDNGACELLYWALRNAGDNAVVITSLLGLILEVCHHERTFFKLREILYEFEEEVHQSHRSGEVNLTHFHDGIINSRIYQLFLECPEDPLGHFIRRFSQASPVVGHL